MELLDELRIANERGDAWRDMLKDMDYVVKED